MAKINLKRFTKGISKDKIKGFISGLAVSMGTWFLIVNLQQYLLKVSPISNQYVLGILLILIGGYLARN